MSMFFFKAKCVCPFFIEIIEIIEIFKNMKKKLRFALVFFRFWSISN